MMTDRARQPKGSPTGGEFAQMGGAESGVQLLVLDHESAAALIAAHENVDRDWGEVNLTWGDRTPWGEAQQVETLADGIARIGTASHGGFKLSAQRNREVPAPLRREGGWYEEDCEFHIVTRTFPEIEEFHRGGYTTEELLQVSDEGVRRWFGRQWAATTGNPVPQETLDAELLEAGRQATRNAERDAKPDNDTFKVADVPTAGLTPAQARSVQKDLSQLWRDDNGRVRSLHQILTEDGVTGREKRYADGKTKYALMQQAKPGDPQSVLKVSKSTYEALAGSVPDTVSPQQRTRDEKRLASDKLRDANAALKSLQWVRRHSFSASDDKRARDLEARIVKHTAERDAADAALEEFNRDK